MRVLMSAHPIRNHIVTSFIAGIVAILPVAGMAITIVYFENQVAGSWLKNQGFYFFGLGLLIFTAVVYLIGLTVSTFVGRWIWGRVDGLLDRTPVLGGLYLTLKQILGYGEGPKGLFQRVVLVAVECRDRYEIGLVTREASDDTQGRIVVFVPNAPTPTSGRLVYVDPDLTQPSSLTVSQAMQTLVSLGSLTAETR
jgi:uncharacterized membrane protein